MGVLDGQVAIMTGGGTGIGRAAALMLAAEGAQVVVAGRRKAPIEAVAAEIAKAGGRAVARACDVAKPAEARALAEWTVAQYGRVDVLVNNAGHSSKRRNVRWVEQDDWDAVVAVNLTGVYALTQAVLPNMIERGGGTIVTVSSLAALKPGLIGGAPYGAAKAGVRNLMGHVHTVLREKGIRATTIMPAEVDTPILDNRPLVARRQGPRQHDAGRGRGAGDHALRDAARAHRDRGDGDQPDDPARPERRSSGPRGTWGPRRGRNSGSRIGPTAQPSVEPPPDPSDACCTWLRKPIGSRTRRKTSRAPPVPVTVRSP